MTQGEIQKILERLDPKKWITTKEIAIILGKGISTVSSNLGSMRIYGEVESKWSGYNKNRRFKHRLTKRGRGL